MDQEKIDNIKIASIIVMMLLIAISIIGYIVYKFFSGNVFYGLATIASFIWIFFILYLWSDIFDNLETLGQIAGAAALLGVAGIIYDLKNNHDSELDFKIFSKVIESNCPYELQPKNIKQRLFLRELQDILIKKCGTKHITVLQDATYNSLKALYLDPATGLVDSVRSDFFSEEGNLTCKELAIEFEKLCPGYFSKSFELTVQ